MPSAAEASEVAESRRVLDALNSLIVHVGEAYVEVSGQTAAMQAVVADLRRCGTFLHHRLAGEPPPAPWLTAAARRGTSNSSSPAVTPPARRASPSQYESFLAPSTPGFQSPPPPSTPFTASSGPGGPSPAAPCTSADPSPAAATSGGATSSAAARPPLPGVGSGAGGARAGSVGRAGPSGRTPAAAAPPRNLAAMPAAGRPSGAGGPVSRSRDASPMRRGTAIIATAAAAPLRSASPTPVTAATPQARGAVAAAVASSSSSSGTDSHGQEDGSVAGGVNYGACSHLPPAAQRALAAAAALAGDAEGLNSAQGYHYDDSGQQGGQQGQGDAARPKPAGLPQLPLPLRRAMQRYRETLQTRDQLLLQYQQRRSAAGTSSTASSTSLADTVAIAGCTYRSALGRHYPTTPHQGAAERGGGTSNSSNGGGGSGGPAQAAAQLSRMCLGSWSAGSAPPQSVAELRRRAQVVFAALVAAQTWLIQSLSGLAQPRGTPGSVAAANRRTAHADACAALLADVELLRLELDDLQAHLLSATAAAAASTPSPNTAAAGAAAGTSSVCMGGAIDSSCPSSGNSNSSSDVLADVADALGVDGEELEEAAALWRNRFLRALMSDAGPGGAASAGPGSRRGGMRSGLGALQQPLLPAPQQLQQQQQQQERLSQHGPLAGPGDANPCLRRPLGFWLPDAMWAHVFIPAVDAAAPAAAAVPGVPVSSVPSPADAAVLCGRLIATELPPWHVLLPGARLAAAASAATGAARRTLAAASPVLLCSSGQEAVAHGRAQLQLQATAFQLLLEGSLAAPLLPRQRPSLPPAAAGSRWQPPQHHQHLGYQQQQAEAAELAWEQWLAQCRLAHLLLFKGAWNRLCSVAELEMEEEVEETE